MESKIDPNSLRIVSINPARTLPARMAGRPEDYLEVTFVLGPYFVNYTVYVSRTGVSDDNVVRLARQYAHVQFKELAEATLSWSIPQPELAVLLSAQTGR